MYRIGRKETPAPLCAFTSPSHRFLSACKKEVIPGAEEELDEAQEEEKERERQALADRVEYQARLDDVRPGDYQIQVRNRHRQ